MEVKNFRAIVFKKIFYLTLLLFLFRNTLIFSYSSDLLWGVNFWGITNWFNSGRGTLKLDWVALRFLLIVSLVTSIVSLYREIYMQGYQLSRFVRTKILFFISIILLLFSDRSFCLIIGWDWLGVSSIFLIMFYPNKITMYNSILTMVYNRGGDIVLILALGLSVFFGLNRRVFFPSSGLIIVLILLLLCSLTKRAQFPLSSWLPAAISAPTPISAMVHSSTLVTAGLYLVSKVSLAALDRSWRWFLAFSSLRFVGGRAIALFELDFKKIVAFSTMRQIRMVIVFFYLGFLALGLGHIVVHALFKTLLFCCCGFYFLNNYSDQLFAKISTKNTSLLNSLLFFRIFRIRGLIFSGSFFTKDKILEALYFHFPFYGVSLLFWGGLLTLLYCARFARQTIKASPHPLEETPKSYKYSLLFGLATLIVGRIFPIFTPTLVVFRINNLETIFLFSFFLVLVSMKKMDLKIKIFLLSVQDIFYMKTLIFSRFSRILSPIKVKEFFHSDSFLSPSLIILKREKTFWTGSFLRFCFYLLVFIDYSFSLMNVALKLLKCEDKK